MRGREHDTRVRRSRRMAAFQTVRLALSLHARIFRTVHGIDTPNQLGSQGNVDDSGHRNSWNKADLFYMQGYRRSGEWGVVDLCWMWKGHILFEIVSEER